MNKDLLKWGMLVTAGVVLLDALFLEKYYFEVNEFDIGTGTGDRKLKLILLTDLHLRKYVGPSYVKLANKINALEPDLILISGDLVDETGTFAPAKKFFSLLNNTVPKVGIMGNHDHKSRVGLQEFHQLYKDNNGFLLINESRAFTIGGKRVMITGLDDYIEGNACLPDALKGVGKEKDHLLLIHSPKQQEKIRKELKALNASRQPDEQVKFHYIFAGHNHGGQVKFFNYAPVMPEKSGKYMNGWYNKNSPFLYVSKGFGNSTLPFRFNSRSEVTVLNLLV